LCDLLGRSVRKLEIAELGIGVNSHIRALSGQSLIDEKCAGTVHIAVGDNARYGGKNHSEIHEDLVSVHPTLTVDKRSILDHGHYTLIPQVWHGDTNQIKASPVLYAPATRVRRTLIRAGQDEQGGLEVHRTVIAERLCCYCISNTAVNQLLWNVYTHIPQFPVFADLQFLRKTTPAEPLAKILALLLEHKLIELDPKTI
jgi:hypothetical protein